MQPKDQLSSPTKHNQNYQLGTKVQNVSFKDAKLVQLSISISAKTMGENGTANISRDGKLPVAIRHNWHWIKFLTKRRVGRAGF